MALQTHSVCTSLGEYKEWEPMSHVSVLLKASATYWFMMIEHIIIYCHSVMSVNGIFERAMILPVVQMRGYS